MWHNNFTKLYLARHAETNYNIERLANADPTVDVHLSGKGIDQAKNLAKLLANAAYEAVYISELPRTRQTAEIINEEHGKELIVDPQINDNNTGYESRPVAEWLEAFDESGDRWNVRFNDGESLNEAAARAQNFIDDLRTKSYDAVLVVTHGFMTQAIFGYLENKSLEEAGEFNLIQGAYAEFDL